MKYIDLENRFDKFKESIRKFLRLPEEIKVDNTKRQREFSKLDSDTKHRLISPHLDFYSDAIAKRTEVVPVMSTLAATLIVITTFNKDLVPLKTDEVKFLLSLFLILIPSTLHFYMVQKEKAIKAALKIVASYQGEHILDIFKKATFWDYMNSSFPRIVIYLFYASVSLVLLRIWLN